MNNNHVPKNEYKDKLLNYTHDAVQTMAEAASCILPLCTTWLDVETHILHALRCLPETRSWRCVPTLDETTAIDTACARHVPLQLHAWWTTVLTTNSITAAPDAVLNTLRHLFVHARCGVLVAIRAGRVALIAPFANAAYTNTWSSRLVTDVHTYTQTKARASNKPPERLLPPSAWWLNGGVVCNVMPENIWGDSHIHELLQQLCATRDAYGSLPDCTFFFNKRDFPQRTLDGSEPLAAFTGDAHCPREAYVHHAPIVSFYGGAAFADCVAPLTEDWKLVLQLESEGAEDTTTRDATVGWEHTCAKAVWRGAPTGYALTPAHNPRLALVQAAATPTLNDYVDAVLVCSGAGGRDRLVPIDTPSSLDSCEPQRLPLLRLQFFDPACTTPPLPTTSIAMPLADQRAAFRYIIYVDGHCAANRYGALMHSGRVILKVTSMHDIDGGGRQWLFPSLVGMYIGTDGQISIRPADAAIDSVDHCVIDTDLSNMRATIQYLRDHDTMARTIARTAAAIAPSRVKITATWLALLRHLNEACCCAGMCVPPGHDIWFSPFDEEYARCGKPCTSQFYSTVTPF